jgi:hypothetical protein
MVAVICRIAIVLALGLLAAPAQAEIEKFMFSCDGKLCPFFRVSVTIPDGWVEDKEATNYFKAVMLLPKDAEFDKAPVKIYAVARYNKNKLPLADFIPDSIKDWKSRAKDAKIVKLEDYPRPSGQRFVRYQFDARSLKEQGYELQAVTKDMDKDGNEFVVTITLSANSLEARKAAEAAYKAILAKY